MFTTHRLVFSFLLLALSAVACGGDDSVVTDDQGGNSDFPKIIRMVESTTIFTADDLKSIGWKAQKDFLLDYPGSTTAKWGFLNQAEVGVLIYSNAEDAKTLGVTAAEAQTFHNELGEAPGDGTMDRTSCQSAGWQSAVKEIVAGSTKVSASYLEPHDNSLAPPFQKMPCPVRVPTYNDYTVVGNVVMLCEGDGGKPLEASTNCKEIEKWLTK
ncbi:MAG: hypothetical protein OSB68_06095 [Dehalococcoidia bacterium]|nr:hypothetical protein [Dehalococcoidia bacterium]